MAVSVQPSSPALGAATSPLFPIIIYGVQTEADMRDVASIGFNTTFYGPHKPEQRHGLWVLADVHGGFTAEQRLAISVIDEPECVSTKDGLPGYPPSKVAEICREAKVKFPGIPTVTMFHMAPWLTQAYMELPDLDIIGIDPYPHYHGMNPVAICNHLDYVHSIGTGKPVWVVLQAWNGRWRIDGIPTAWENRAMMFMALIHGASGIGWYSYRFSDRLGEPEECSKAFPELWKDIGECVRILKVIARALNVTPYEGYHVSGTVHYRIVSDNDNRWLLAVEVSGKSCTAKMIYSTQLSQRKEERKFMGYETYLKWIGNATPSSTSSSQPAF